MKRACVAWLALVLAINASHATRSLAESSPLAPYARLAASPEARALLTHARLAMERYWSPARAATDSVNAARVPDWPGRPAPMYVSLVRGHATRACVGSPAPTRGTLSETVAALAVEVLHADRRRPPVRHDELDDLRIVLSFTDEGETVASPMLVDPGRDGLLITSPRGAVAFLPGEARTIRWALREARRIGVLEDGVADATFKRLHVVTLAEPARPVHDEEDADALP
jgi:AMMECR1 domain-containing protein